MNEVNAVICHFAIAGQPASCVHFGCGHINETYMVACDSGRSYILQKINTSVFNEPEKLMANIAAVTSYLAAQVEDPRAAMRLVFTTDGLPYYKTEQNEYWRMYDFVMSSICLQKAECLKDIYNSGLAFGRFQRQLENFPAKTLYEPIANFHNTRVRYDQLRQATKVNYNGRLEQCRAELEFAWEREAEAGIIVDLLASGELPFRVTHNDTKLNNVLLDFDTHDPLCVIDLDTVMPGSALYDYGDSIRFGASTAAEDEKDLTKVSCDMELFRTYTEGFFAGCDGSLTKREIEMLPLGAKVMTLECGLRFLADYLNGDVYFHTTYPEQNLDRARTQMKLVADMEAKWDTMHQIIKEAVK